MSKIGNIDVKTLYKWMQNQEVIIIDVREPSEYSVEKIDGAINIPLAKICLDDLSKMDIKNKKIVMQCRSGARSMTACEKLAADSSLELWNLEGGILAWRAFLDQK